MVICLGASGGGGGGGMLCMCVLSFIIDCRRHCRPRRRLELIKFEPFANVNVLCASVSMAHIPLWNLQSPMSFFFQLPLFLHYYFYIALYFTIYSLCHIVSMAHSSIAILACANNFQLNWLHRNYFWQNFSTMQFHLWRLQFRYRCCYCCVFRLCLKTRKRVNFMIDFLIFYFIVKIKRYFNIASSRKRGTSTPKKLSICTPLASTHFMRGFTKQTHFGQKSKWVVIFMEKDAPQKRPIEIHCWSAQMQLANNFSIEFYHPRTLATLPLIENNW